MYYRSLSPIAGSLRSLAPPFQLFIFSFLFLSGLFSFLFILSLSLSVIPSHFSSFSLSHLHHLFFFHLSLSESAWMNVWVCPSLPACFLCIVNFFYRVHSAIIVYTVGFANGTEECVGVLVCCSGFSGFSVTCVYVYVFFLFCFFWGWFCLVLGTVWRVRSLLICRYSCTVTCWALYPWVLYYTCITCTSRSLHIYT